MNVFNGHELDLAKWEETTEAKGRRVGMTLQLWVSLLWILQNDMMFTSWCE